MTTILIVDDELLVCDVLKHLVELEGYQAICAYDGKQAMQLIADHDPDLIVTDLIMPEKDGLELITEIRQMGKTTKIVAISGGTSNLPKEPQLRVAGLMGADMCVAKPLDYQALIGSINLLLQ